MSLDWATKCSHLQGSTLLMGTSTLPPRCPMTRHLLRRPSPPLLEKLTATLATNTTVLDMYV